MENQSYSITETQKNNRTYYGLCIKDTNGKKYSYNYISESKEDLEDLVKQMSAGYISPVHFTDIIADFITKNALDKISSLNT